MSDEMKAGHPAPGSPGAAVEAFLGLLGQDPEGAPSHEEEPAKSLQPEGGAESVTDAAASEPNNSAPDSGTPEKVKVKNAETGEVEEVDPDEAYRMGLRQADYTRKTQYLAELRKRAEAEAEAAARARAEYSRKLDEAARWLGAVIPQEPDWATLRQQVTPEEYAAAHLQWSQYQQALRAVQAERERLEREEAERRAQAERERLEQERQRLLEAVPEWKDSQVRNRELEELVQWLGAKGFSNEELASITDHRLLVALRDAYRFERGKTVTQRKQGLKTAPPGAATGESRPVPDKGKALEALRKTGRLPEAAEAMLHFV